MQNQLDLSKEAKHMDRFRRDFRDDKIVEFSQPINEFVKENVLVETLMEGRWDIKICDKRQSFYFLSF